jgi:hypothetical protein
MQSGRIMYESICLDEQIRRLLLGIGWGKSGRILFYSAEQSEHISCSFQSEHIMFPFISVL